MGCSAIQMNRRYFKLILAGLILGMAAPVWAKPSPRSTDRVESAGATLSETLAAHRSEQAKLMQMQAQQFALFREGAFLEPLTVSPTGTVPSAGRTSSVIQIQPLSQAAPAVVVEALSPGVNWLIGQGDPSVTGFTPVAGREGLLVSYQIPTTDPLAFLRGRSWTYDNAVGAVAFTLQGQPDAAKKVLTSLQGLMAADGSLGFSYQVDSSFVDGHVRTGTLAWVGYAMALYQRQTGDASFQASAEKIGAYLKNLQMGSGSIKGGPDVSWVSTEHNVDAYFFYREMYRGTGQASYLTTATQIRNSLLANHWTGSLSKGHFLQGIGDPAPALDANSWGAIFLAAIGRTAQANQALKYAEATFRNTQKITGTTTRLTGYSPDSARKTVWLEGTAGVAAAYQRAGQGAKAGSILSQFSAWNGGIPYAMPRYTDADGNTFSNLLAVPSTAWHQIALSVRSGSSPFWDAD